ncbi:MAG: alginate O-acetyltransferase AlgX-related protein, partial [Roseimicrobium sp.]
MKRLFVVAVMVVASCTWTRAEDFTAAVKSLLHTSPAEALSVPGSDANWLFLRRELEHLAVGDLASANLAQVNKEGTDAIPVITKYAEELKALGVELLLVPVPAKASIYPEKLSATADPASVPTMTAFFAKLNAAGVEVLDLEAAFKAERAKYPERQLYCATDSHWSPYAAKLVAQVIAERFKTNPAVIANAMRDL